MEIEAPALWGLAGFSDNLCLCVRVFRLSSDAVTGGSACLYLSIWVSYLSGHFYFLTVRCDGNCRHTGRNAVWWTDYFVCVFRAVSLNASGHPVHAHVWFKYGTFEQQSYLSIRYYWHQNWWDASWYTAKYKVQWREIFSANKLKYLTF